MNTSNLPDIDNLIKTEVQLMIIILIKTKNKSVLLSCAQKNWVPDRFGNSFIFTSLVSSLNEGAKSGLNLQVTGALSDVRTPSILEPLNRKFISNFIKWN
jgi:hypothetical protein